MMRFQKINQMGLLCRMLLFVVIMAGMNACEKEISYPPASLTKFNGAVGMVHADTSVTFSWEPAFTAWEGDREPPKVTYEITIAKDADFSDPEAILVIQDSLTFTIGKERLTPLQDYYARFRSIAGPTEAKSDWINYVDPRQNNKREFQVLDKPAEINYFKPIKVHELIDVAVYLRWAPNVDLERLVLTSDDGSFNEDFVLTAEQLRNGVLQIDGLKPDMLYHARLILNDGRFRGTLLFRTKPDVTGAGYTDLRTFTDPLILVQTLPNAAPGTKLVLKRGAKYTFPESYRFDKSVTIMSEPGFGEPAHIEIASSLNIANGITIDSIKFDDVKLTSNIAGGYVFNIQADANVRRIEFENCIISDHRGVTRVRPNADAFLLERYVVNNCIIQSIGNYSVAHVDNVNANIRDISITNSTIIDATRVVFTANRSTNFDRSLTFNSVTFHNAPGSGQYLFNYNNSGSLTDGVNIVNCLINPVSGGRGQQGRNLTVTVNNSFTITSFHATNGPIPNLPSAGKNATEVFVNPASGDFTIKEPTLYEVGDPRWRP